MTDQIDTTTTRTKVKLREPRTGKRFEAFFVPLPAEDPGEAMIEWLGRVDPKLWEGDENGIVIYRASEVLEWKETAAPGDLVAREIVQGGLGELRRFKAEDLHKTVFLMP